MWPDQVVEGLQIGQYIGLRTGLRWILFEKDQLTLEAAKEMHCYGVVIGIALAEHALPDSIERQPFPEGQSSVLDAPVSVKDEALGRLPCPALPGATWYQ